jgi:large subunit ribosomal protein L21e
VKRSHGTYSKHSRAFVRKGNLTIPRLLAAYEEGDRVRIDPNPAHRKGRPHLRFKGMTGTVTGKTGKAYNVDVRVGGKVKTLMVTNLHLAKAA